MHLARYIDYWARERGDHPALIQEDTTLRWREFGVAASTLAAQLHGAGAKPGDRIGCLLPNRLEWCIAFAATQFAETLCVPLNPMFGPGELRHIAADAGCRLVVSNLHLLPKLDDRFTASDDDLPAVFDLVSAARVAAVELFPDRPQPAPARREDEGAPAVICYTSGTTGRPKGAVHTHRTIAAMTVSLSRGYGMTKDDVFLLVAPLSFTGGVICNLAVSLALGATLVLEAGFDPPRTLALIERHRVTAFGGAAIFWQRLADLDGFAAADMSSLCNGFTGGSPVSPDLVRRFIDKGVGIRQAYGCTEICGGATLPTAEQAVLRPESCGRAMIGLDLEIRDETGNVCGSGEIGEITLRGPQVMVGYWQQPEQTMAAFDGEWFCSGDMGYLNDFGELVVVDRKKNMVISGGVNIYPAEVEAALVQIDGVLEAIAFGVPSKQWGEELVAMVRVAVGFADGTLHQAARNKLGAYKCPKRFIQSRQEFEKTATGKMARERVISLARSRIDDLFPRLLE